MAKKFKCLCECPNRPDTGLLLLRLSVGGLMLAHGLAKLSGVDGLVGMFEGAGMPGFFAYAIYIGEILAPLMIIAGFRTRIGALLLAFTMLVATLMAHSADMFSMAEYGGLQLENIYLFFFGGLSLFFLGGGKFGVSSNNKWD